MLDLGVVAGFLFITVRTDSAVSSNSGFLLLVGYFLCPDGFLCRNDRNIARK